MGGHLVAMARPPLPRLLVLLAPLLLLLLTTVAGDCPEDSACLHIGHCPDEDKANNSMLITTEQELTDDFMNSCMGTFELSELNIRPLGKHRWNVSLQFPNKQKVLHLGKALSVVALDGTTTFRPDNGAEETVIEADAFTGLKTYTGWRFTIDYQENNLLDVLGKLNVTFQNKPKGRKHSSEQPEFWQHVEDMIPCDATEIYNDCGEGVANCTDVGLPRNQVICEAPYSIWMKTNESTWLNLHNITCEDSTKEWITDDGNGPEGLYDRKAEIQCATEMPEPWAVSKSAGLIASEKALKPKKKKDRGFSLMDSPYIWVMIGLVGLAALVAVVIAATFVARGLANRNSARREGATKSEVSFKRLPQEPQPAVPGSSSDNSGSETDLRKVDGVAKAQEGAAPAPHTPVSKMASSAAGVTNVSSLKTFKETPTVEAAPAIPV